MTYQTFIQNFLTIAIQRITSLPSAMVGDYKYQPKNTFSYSQKKKIFSYLQVKYLNDYSEIVQSRQPNLSTYDSQIFKKPVSSVKDMRNNLLKGRTQLQSAQIYHKHLLLSRKAVQGEFFNQIAYQFDKQRKCSMGWGYIFGSVICSTIYRRGKTARKAALFLLCGHAFGHISNRVNIDKYFDCVYHIFEEDAVEFAKIQKIEEEKINQSRELKKQIIQE